MFESHTLLNEPSDDMKLWRYMDLSKFMAILENETLYFSSLTELNDPYEGQHTRIEYEVLTSVKESREQQQNTTNNHFIKKARNLICVSCWHTNSVESSAMWSLYASRGEGIAVVTSFANFKKSFLDEDVIVYGGLVKYIDYETFVSDSINDLQSSTYKRYSFEHENEFRAIYSGVDGFFGGIQIRVNVNTLIKGVYLSPVCPKWFYELVKNIMIRYKVNVEINYSDLNKGPHYITC